MADPYNTMLEDEGVNISVIVNGKKLSGTSYKKLLDDLQKTPEQKAAEDKADKTPPYKIEFKPTGEIKKGGK
jgi:hypothetical protein